MEEVPVVEATSEDDMHFDPEHQMMTGPDGELYFELFWSIWNVFFLVHKR
jgi:hypothetical protein